MATTRRRKCLCCKNLFRPDPRQKKRQRYCANTICRKQSKTASQKKWLSQRKNGDYFSGAENVQRVQEWRKRNPEYWRKNDHALTGSPLQETSLTQVIDNQKKTTHLTTLPLQEITSVQVPVLIGIISHLTGETLQDEIAITMRRLLTLGADILNNPVQPSSPP